MISSKRTFAGAVALSCLVWLPASAADTNSGDLVITRAWSRATPGGAKVAGGYLTIENKGRRPERLKTASTAHALRTEIHEMAISAGVMTMRALNDGLVIAPGQSVTLAPGGGHLMFIGLDAPLRVGEQVPVTLSFEHAGDVKVALDVQPIGAQAPARTETAEPVRRAEHATPVSPVMNSEADESFFTHLHAEKAMANVTVSPGRAGPVEIAIQLEDANELPLSAEAVAVTLTNPEHGAAPVTANAERVGNDQWRVRMSAPLSGRWSLGLDIRITSSDAVNVVSPILLR
ncbi:copper chaperone PCu(A)C [Bradyrhizobium liaoningense]|uniref:copper chaperone PCu(A)C n=1 Tax=Bradyrhizobium liaoningense TaxID=43992 RepID=UPI001BA951B8|nr:copper chaperone PCu(A)C [Bradyrhizobium liaoningense]